MFGKIQQIAWLNWNRYLIRPETINVISFFSSSFVLPVKHFCWYSRWFSCELHAICISCIHRECNTTKPERAKKNKKKRGEKTKNPSYVYYVCVVYLGLNVYFGGRVIPIKYLVYIYKPHIWHERARSDYRYHFFQCFFFIELCWVSVSLFHFHFENVNIHLHICFRVCEEMCVME